MGLIYLDTETSGLDWDEDTLLEIGAVATDRDMTKYLGHFQRVVGYSPEFIEETKKNADPIVQEMHTTNGLWEECMRSENGLGTVLHEFLDWLDISIPRHDGQPHILIGDCTYFDFMQLFTWNKDFRSRFHYRFIDTSAYNQMLYQWHPTLAAVNKFEIQMEEEAKSGFEIHRALEDAYMTLHKCLRIRQQLLRIPNEYGGLFGPDDEFLSEVGKNLWPHEYYVH